MNLDLEKIWTNLLTKIQDLELEKLWSNWEQLEWADLLSCWESLDAITKIVLTMMFTNYFIFNIRYYIKSIWLLFIRQISIRKTLSKNSGHYKI